VQRLLKNVELLGGHRGCQRSRLGQALFAALQEVPAGEEVPCEPAEEPPQEEEEEEEDVSDGVSGPGLCLQGTGVVAVGSTPASTSTQSAGVVTPPAAPPAKQEPAVQQTAAVEVPTPAVAETTPRDAGVMSPPVSPPAEVRQKAETELLPEQVEEEEVGAESDPASSGADPTATAQEIDQLMASSIVLKTYRFVRSTNLVGRRDSAGQLKAATQVSSPRPIVRSPAEMQEEHLRCRHRVVPGSKRCEGCWSELRQEAASLMGQLNVHPEGGCTAADAANALRMHRGGCTAATRSELAMARKCIYANRADFGQLRELIAELMKLVLTGEVLGET
jgi:hypothetical protein